MESQFWMRMLTMAPMLAVELAGVVLAGIAMRSPHRRPAAICLALGLLGFIVVQIGRPLFFEYLINLEMQGRLSHAQVTDRMKIFGICDLVLDTLSMSLLIVAALAWRGRGTMPAAALAAPISTAPPTSPIVPQASLMPPLSRGLRLTAMYGPLLLGLVCTIAAIIIGQDRRSQGAAFALLGVAVLISLLGIIAFAMTIHALWMTLQAPPRGAGVSGIARTTPAAAVGLLFVPLFNLYWVFQVWVGFAKDCNRTLDARGIAAPRLSPGLAIAVCICTLVSIIPYVGLIGTLPNMVMMPILLWTSMGAANALRSAGV